MKILLGGFHQEVNSFAPGTTGYERYRTAGSAHGTEMIRLVEEHTRRNDSVDALSAQYQAIRQAGGEVIPGGFMYAQAGAVIEQSVLDNYIYKLVKTIKDNLPLDGVFLVLHGAAQTTG